MKKSLLKFLLSLCILLSSVYSPLFANNDLGDIILQNTGQSFSLAVNTTHEHHKATITGTLEQNSKVLEINAAEIKEEESKNNYLKGSFFTTYITTAFYLLSLLYLFSYLKNSNTLQGLFTFLPTAGRRFVLYQVFRL
tara:strand:+ start:81097 stop:81510 length:414 start_codon:yes stop_codon:yes gene_type:complete